MSPRTLSIRTLCACALVAPNLLLPTLGGTETVENEKLEAKLNYVSLKNWEIILPEERWDSAEEGIEIPHLNSEGFKAEKTGQLKLEVDTNDDGRLDKNVKGNGGFLKLKSRGKDGETFQYAVRLRAKSGKWQFSTGCAMSGKVGGMLIKLFDQNHNGRYDDFGEDAMLIGSGFGATLLSRVINLDGDLYQLEILEDGSRIECLPYTGESGLLDVTSHFDSNGKLVSAVFGSESEDIYFNPARSAKPFRVPAGEYSLVSGYVAKGGETVMMGSGKMSPILVKSGGTRTIEWGGPLVAEFDVVKEDDLVIVQPNINFYGVMGEEYHTFTPNAKSPKLIVTDKRTRKEVASGRFGGC